MKLKKVGSLPRPAVTVNGMYFSEDQLDMNALFQRICFMVEDRPHECRRNKLFDRKESILYQFQMNWGAANSTERRERVWQRLINQVMREEDRKPLQDKRATSGMIILSVTVACLLTGFIFLLSFFFCRKSKLSDQQQQMVNEEVMQYF